VTLLDANLVLYAYNTSAEHHDAARRWLEAELSGARPVRMAWISILAFLRISTNPRAFPYPFSASEASEIVGDWFGRSCFGALDPGERHLEILRGLMTANQCRGPLVMDAHLAALAIEHGAVLATTDRDFARFPELDWINPLETAL